MPVYNRGEAAALTVVHDWPDGFGWLAHPHEDALRTSYAVREEGSVWLLDPLDADGLDERIAELGPVAGVVVCSSYHARDAGRLADRHEVAVHVPGWMDRIESQVDAPIERFEETIAGFETHRVEPLPTWGEAMLYRERDATLYSADVVSRFHATDGEVLGLALPVRPVPPREWLADREVDQVLCGHGRPVQETAGTALRLALDGARVNLPGALATQALPMTRRVFHAIVE